MRGQPKRQGADESGAAAAEAAAEAVLQIKVWLTGISPMVWRRVLVPASFTLRELHGVIQVAMGEAGQGSACEAGGIAGGATIKIVPVSVFMVSRAGRRCWRR